MADEKDVPIDEWDNEMLDGEASGEQDLPGPIDITPEKNGGVIKEIIKKGKGPGTPTTGDKVFVHYVGKLTDGTVFDSSRDRDQTFSFSLGQGQVIKGWDIAVASMKSGEVAKFTIGPDYAYGKTGSPPKIPPMATLIFEIELFDWKMTDCTKKQDEGVRKRILDHGDGYSTPNDGATVQIEIIGRYNDQKSIREFQRRTLTYTHGEASEYDLIEGIDIAVGKMKSGERSLIYVRKDYAWGDNPPKEFNLPSDYTEVMYELHLKSFEKLKETWEMSEMEKLEQAKIAKEKGSSHFKKEKFQLALKQYKRIPKYLGPFKDEFPKDDEEGDVDMKGDELRVDNEEKRSLLLAGHLNLAMVHIKLNQYLEAIKNCDSALEIEPNNTKGLFRRGIGYYHIQEYEKAIQDFEKVIQIEPNNKAAKNQLIISKHALKQQKEKEKAMFTTMISKYLQSPSLEETTKGNQQLMETINEVQFSEPELQEQPQPQGVA